MMSPVRHTRSAMNLKSHTTMGSMVGLSSVMSQLHRDRATGQPYESGVVPTSFAHRRHSLRFYLNAMFLTFSTWKLHLS